MSKSKRQQALRTQHIRILARLHQGELDMMLVASILVPIYMDLYGSIRSRIGGTSLGLPLGIRTGTVEVCIYLDVYLEHF